MKASKGGVGTSKCELLTRDETRASGETEKKGLWYLQSPLPPLKSREGLIKVSIKIVIKHSLTMYDILHKLQ